MDDRSIGALIRAGDSPAPPAAAAGPSSAAQAEDGVSKAWGEEEEKKCRKKKKRKESQWSTRFTMSVFVADHLIMTSMRTIISPSLHSVCRKLIQSMLTNSPSSQQTQQQPLFLP